VDEDKSMEGLIDTGETWMEPLLEMRDWLKKIRDDVSMRQGYRRNLQDGLGPFTKESRVRVLRRLLQVQKEIEIPLITSEELSGIQWIWYHDFHDAPSVTEIYYEVFGERFIMNKDINERRAKDRQLLEEICEEQDVPVELVEQLLQIEKDKSGLMRRHNLFTDIDVALKTYLKRLENMPNINDPQTSHPA
jgi:DNA sulfur modification protein DndC